MAESTDVSREELELIVEVLRRLQEAFGGATQEQLLDLGLAIRSVEPAKRRRLLGSLLIATASSSTAAKAGVSDLLRSDNLLLKSVYCQHGLLVGKCPLC